MGATPTFPTAVENNSKSAMVPINDIAGRRAGLSPAKRVLLEKWLRGEVKMGPKTSTISRCADRDRAPLSFAQQRLWFFSQLDPESPLYNIPFTLRVKGRLNLAALRSALDAIVARHEILRTCFMAEDGSPMQFVGAPAPVPLIEADLSGEPIALREAKLEELIASESRRPFDLSLDLMLRSLVVHLAEDEHLLLLTMHHIASDHWSWGIFLQELATFYKGFDAGQLVMLPELPIQYADFAIWQRNWLSGPVMEQQLAYWKKKLAGAPPFLELPTDRPRPSVLTFRGEWQMVSFPVQLSEAVKTLARREGTTLFMTMMAAFVVLLHRYTQQRDIVVGTPIAGRMQMQTEGLIGFFVNTLAMRSDLSANPTFLQLLQQVRETTLEALSYQDLPFEKLVEELRPERSAGHSPLLQVMFVMRNASGPNVSLPGLIATQVESSTGTSKFDLTMFVEETEGGLEVGLEYNSDLFERATVRRMLGHFRTLWEGIADNPAEPISKLPLLTAAERSQLVVEWNNTRTEYPRDQTVHALFEQQAAATPAADAVIFRNERLTYVALNQRANRLAHYLRRLGVGRDLPVAICLERSLDLIVALLGILKAGGAYVSLDPAYPKARLAFMLNDVRPLVLLTQQKLRFALPNEYELQADASKAEAAGADMAPPLRVICLDSDWADAAPEHALNPPGGATADDLAYISYTSGSTGRSKGVCIPHRGVVRLVKNTNFAHFGADEVFLQLAPVAFDASTLEIWGALLNGGRLVVFPPGAPSLVDLGEAVQKHRITTLWLTAGLFHQMVEEQLASLKDVRQLLAGGDTLSPTHVKTAFQALKNGRVINGYGPTENTTFTTCHPVTEMPPADRSVPLGRPIANTEVYILDEHLQPVPIGVPGELFVGGDGLARGYLHRPELTAEKFVPHPFARESDARLYRTGDRARYRPNGDIEFLGRLDLQIKVRGFRIELEEIEFMLGQVAGVRECTVVAMPDAGGDKRLVAYVVPDASAALTAAELRDALQTKLPDCMVPSAFVFLEVLPLNANGKVDRAALPAPEASILAPGTHYVAPRNELETRLAKIWERVLGVSPIGITQRFFELGGHSLLAVRLVAQIEKELERRLPVAAIFQAPSVEQLAALMREGVKPPRDSALIEIQPQGTCPPLFLVHGVGGGMVWGYANLARHLGPDQPVYAFKPRAGESQEKTKTIEDMAAHYVSELRRFQPRGPYRLGGYCFGGNVAYEMARQLVQQGEEVSLLVLMNSSPPNSSYNRFRWTPVALWRFLCNLCYWTEHFFRMDPGLRRQFLQWKRQTWLRSARNLLRSKPKGSANFNAEDFIDLSMLPAEQRKIWADHVRALTGYRNKPYNGRVTLFRTRGHQLICSFDPYYGWGELARGGVVIHLTPGAHESLLEEPHVRAVAQKLTAELEAGSRKNKNQEAHLCKKACAAQETIRSARDEAVNFPAAPPRSERMPCTPRRPHSRTDQRRQHS